MGNIVGRIIVDDGHMVKIKSILSNGIPLKRIQHNNLFITSFVVVTTEEIDYRPLF